MKEEKESNIKENEDHNTKEEKKEYLKEDFEKEKFDKNIERAELMIPLLGKNINL
jgi:hypothetical protein